MLHSAPATANDIKVGVAGFNSAWSCSGPEDDRNIWIAAEWQLNTARAELADAELKIGLIHHPHDWFNQNEREFVQKRISADYDFWLHGHTHDSWVTPTQSHTIIAAGAVGADSSEEFGANLTQVDLSTGEAKTYLFTKRKSHDWTILPIPKHAPSGVWRYTSKKHLEVIDGDKKVEKPQPVDANPTAKYLENRFKRSLKLFSGQCAEWVTPTLSNIPEEKISPNDDEVKVSLDTIISSPRELIISAPSEYGQTCLAYFMSLEAWKRHQQFWMYFDVEDVRPNKHSILERAAEELSNCDQTQESIECIILDSWSTNNREKTKLLNKIYELFPNIPVIRMDRNNSLLTSISQQEEGGRQHEQLYLWSLPRESIRRIVAAYNDIKPIGEESAVTNRIISDLDTLNLHRTALNCLTLLKVSEFDFDESPVNRTEIIKRVLFLLFNTENLPSYKAKPDLKDCEHVLGYLSEHLIREGEYGFTRERFLRDVNTYAQQQLIDLETQVVFDTLFQNNIIIQRGNLFFFRFTYWLFYFAAQRMHHSKDFANFILSDAKYVQHPEIIEFYTGIDRRREDALKVLISDLNALIADVHDICGLPKTLNPYRLGKWETSEEAAKRMQQEVADGVADSNLPDVIKDRYADAQYDRSKPYNQAAGKILLEGSFVQLMQAVRAGSRALRNSDYAEIKLKQELLHTIVLGWEQISRVIMTVLPTLAENNSATFDGVRFLVVGSTARETEFEAKFMGILTLIPHSVTRNFSDDLFSMRIGPLLLDRINKADTNEIGKHELIILLIMRRPKGWEKAVSKYISEVQHNSFYLYDTYMNLRAQYRFSFTTNKVLSEIETLIKMAAAKHISGNKSPGKKLIGKVKNSVLPERSVQND